MLRLKHDVSRGLVCLFMVCHVSCLDMMCPVLAWCVTWHVNTGCPTIFRHGVSRGHVYTGCLTMFRHGVSRGQGGGQEQPDTGHTPHLRGPRRTRWVIGQVLADDMLY